MLTNFKYNFLLRKTKYCVTHFIALFLAFQFFHYEVNAQNAIRLSIGRTMGSLPAYQAKGYYQVNSSRQLSDVSLHYYEELKRDFNFSIGLALNRSEFSFEHHISDPFDEKYDKPQFVRYSIPTFKKTTTAIGFDTYLQKQINKRNSLGLGLSFYAFGKAAISTNITSTESSTTYFNLNSNETSSISQVFKYAKVYYAEDFFLINLNYSRNIGSRSLLSAVLYYNPLANGPLYKTVITGHTLMAGYDDPNIIYTLNDNTFTAQHLGLQIKYSIALLRAKRKS